MTQDPLRSADDPLTIRIPYTVRKLSGRKYVITPDGVTTEPLPHHRIDNALVKALARAFRWRRLLESGAYGCIDELAKDERINPSYVGRVLRMTLLAPDIVEAILEGRQDAGLTMARAMRPFDVSWAQQRRELAKSPRTDLGQ